MLTLDELKERGADKEQVSINKLINDTRQKRERFIEWSKSVVKSYNEIESAGQSICEHRMTEIIIDPAGDKNEKECLICGAIL